MALETDETQEQEVAVERTLGEKLALATSDKVGNLSAKLDTSPRKAEYAAMFDSEREDYEEPAEEEGEKPAVISDEDLEKMSLEDVKALVDGIEEPPAEEEEAGEEEVAEEVKIDLTDEEKEAAAKLNAGRAEDWFSFDSVPMPDDKEVSDFEEFVATDPKHARRVIEFNDRVAAAKGHVQGYHKGRVDNNPRYKDNVAGLRWVFDNIPDVFDKSKFKDPVVAATAYLKQNGKWNMSKDTKVKPEDKQKRKDAEKAKIISDYKRKSSASLGTPTKGKPQRSEREVHPLITEITNLSPERIKELRKSKSLME